MINSLCQTVINIRHTMTSTYLESNQFMLNVLSKCWWKDWMNRFCTPSITDSSLYPDYVLLLLRHASGKHGNAWFYDGQQTKDWFLWSTSTGTCSCTPTGRVCVVHFVLTLLMSVVLWFLQTKGKIQ